MNLPWLQSYQQQFADVLLREKVPHGILLAGAKGLGKLQLAQNMAQMALCENLSKDGACQICPACVLFNAANHTDYSHICAEKNTIKVDQIRHMTQNVILTNTRYQHKVILIQEAELMNKAAANALLKTLEEPPAKVIIILTCNEIGRILPTIKSRCMKWSISAPKFNVVSEWLAANNSDTADDRDFSLMLNSSAPLMALEMLQNNTISTVKEMIADLKSITSGGKTVADVSKAWISNEWQYLLSVVASCFMLSVKKQYKLNFKQANVQIDVNPQYLMKFIKEMYVYNHRSTTVLKPQLLLEELLLHWKNHTK